MKYYKFGEYYVNDVPKPIIEKPPLGCKPRWLHEEDRRHELGAAIYRALEAQWEIQSEWIEEYNELITRWRCHQCR